MILKIPLEQPGIMPCLRAQRQPFSTSLELTITSSFQQGFPNVFSFPEKHYYTDSYKYVDLVGLG